MACSEWGILLDLDETLVLTSKLEELRRRRAWQQVYRSFSESTLPPGTREFLEKTRNLARLGVVTTSPRPYAEKLLAYHGIELPVLVAYHDVRRKKPDPEPIVRGAEQLELPPRQCIYIGDVVEDIVAATRADAIPVGLSWDGSLGRQPEAQLAKAICSNWKEVLSVVMHITKVC